MLSENILEKETKYTMDRNLNENGFSGHICKFIGETVTIFTESGGMSGRGFTGVIINVSDCFVRLINSIGEAPDCALGSDCDDSCGKHRRSHKNNSFNGVGSVTDIPFDKIVAFVHNAV